MSTWSELVHTVMLATLIECDRAGMSKAETAQAIDAAYPFGVRAHYPYKAWLKVRKAFFAQHGLPRSGDHRTTKDRADDLFARSATTMQESREQNPSPEHGCGHMQGRGPA